MPLPAPPAECLIEIADINAEFECARSDDRLGAVHLKDGLGAPTDGLIDRAVVDMNVDSQVQDQ